MKTKLLIGLLALMCVGVCVGTAHAQFSFLNYPDGSTSNAQDLGFGIAFIFQDVPGDFDYFIHSINYFANLNLVGLPVNGGFVVNGFGYWLDFEGFNGPFEQYGVYACTGVQTNCGFGNRRGTLFL